MRRDTQSVWQFTNVAATASRHNPVQTCRIKRQGPVRSDRMMGIVQCEYEKRRSSRLCSFCRSDVVDAGFSGSLSPNLKIRGRCLCFATIQAIPDKNLAVPAHRSVPGEGRPNRFARKQEQLPAFGQVRLRD